MHTVIKIGVPILGLAAVTACTYIAYVEMGSMIMALIFGPMAAFTIISIGVLVVAACNEFTTDLSV